MPFGRRWIFYAEPALLVAAFVLQLFVSLSLPIFKPINLFTLHITDQSVVGNKGEIRFGLWGFCFLNEYNTGTWDYGICSSPEAGYILDPTIISLLGLSPYLYDVISGVLTGFLVVHPVIATLTLLSIVPGLFPFYRAARITSLILNVVSALLSSVVTAIDLAIIIVARDKLQSIIDRAGLADSLRMQFRVSVGNAPWLSLGAVFCLWVAVIMGSIVVCHCCGSRKYDDASITTEEREEEKKWIRWLRQQRRRRRETGNEEAPAGQY